LIADPVVISSTIQEFQGVRYYRHGRTGFFPTRATRTVKRQMISRAVWEAHHGNIPRGWEVHHQDEDRTHNAYANLLAMAPLDHAALHKRGAFRANGARLAKLPPVIETYVCEGCGKTYQAQRYKRHRWCSNACNIRAYKLRKAARHAG
jgi:hypothetical protein